MHKQLKMIANAAEVVGVTLDALDDVSGPTVSGPTRYGRNNKERTKYAFAPPSWADTALLFTFIVL